MEWVSTLKGGWKVEREREKERERKRDIGTEKQTERLIQSDRDIDKESERDRDKNNRERGWNRVWIVKGIHTAVLSNLNVRTIHLFKKYIVSVFDKHQSDRWIAFKIFHKYWALKMRIL